MVISLCRRRQARLFARPFPAMMVEKSVTRGSDAHGCGTWPDAVRSDKPGNRQRLARLVDAIQEGDLEQANSLSEDSTDPRKL